MLMVDPFAPNLVKESLRFPPRFTEKNVMGTTLSPGIVSLMSVVDPLVFLVWLDLPDSLVLMVPLDPKDSLDKMVPLANVDLKDPMDPKDPPEKLDLKVTQVCKVFPDLKDRLDKLDPVVRLVNKVNIFYLRRQLRRYRSRQFRIIIIFFLTKFKAQSI